MGSLWGLLLTEILFALLFFFLNRQDIFAPSVFMTMVFIVSTIIAILNGENWNIVYSINAAVVIASGIFLFGITDVLVRRLCGVNKRYPFGLGISPLVIERWKMCFIIVADLIVVLLVYGEVRRIALTEPGYTNIFYAYRTITSHSRQRLESQYMNGMVSQAMKLVIVTGFLSALIFINNVLVCRQSLAKNICFLMPTVLLCTMTLITGVRTNILRLSVFCLVSWYILLQHHRNWKFIRILSIAFVVILCLFSFSQSLLGRRGATDVWTVISNYVGASIQHFNQFMEDRPAKNIIFGQETFCGIWNFMYRLGIVKITYSAHAEYRFLNASEFGNVYTFFRRYIQDFGIAGMGIMTIGTSAFFSFMYNRAIRCKRDPYKRTIWVAVYGYLYYIVAISSIDNVVHDYINLGTVLMYLLLHFICWFLFKVRIRFIGIQGRAGR